ncbi:MAG: hypothetical protein QOD56_2741 [Gammaproteobacteria bacterium]|jgi:hypothetical protein|nr:hypothetical protein [Gammaproteobacteria bacterium]
MTRKGLLQTALQSAVFAVVMFAFVSPASAIPAFARKYSLRCTACHEAWPVLNDFGRAFRDNGYQLRLGRDDTVTADPGYWPVAVHITPRYLYTKTTNQLTDQGVKDIGSGGVADAAIDLLMAGVLTKNISFLVVPTGFASDGNVHLESYWAYFSRVFKDSDWLNIRVGQYEIDLPASSHRGIFLTDSYLLYSYHPGIQGGANLSAYDMGENQRGIEFVGHDAASLTRYSVSVFSAQDSLGSRNALSSPSFYGHFQKYFRFKHGPISEAEVGVWGVQANYPTEFLTSEGAPIPGSGSHLQASTRYGVEANVWIGPTVAPLHLDLVYGHGSDKKGLLQTQDDGVLGADRNGTWNGAFLEAIWIPPGDLLHWSVFGRYDIIRNQNQPLLTARSDYNNQDQWTLGLRYTIAYSIRDEVAFHGEVSSDKVKGVGFAGLDQRTDNIMLGVDFAY